MNERVQRARIDVSGLVQGIGFRPFIHQLATERHLAGWVCNTPQGVSIEAEGPPADLAQFLAELRHHGPAQARIDTVHARWLEPAGTPGFVIRDSPVAGPATALAPPDLATCADCLREMRDPANRRHRHPFTNCTHCGPRFTILEDLPYDRARTSMKRFALCPACRAEYENPADRRFHAQPNACPQCGPQLALWTAQGTPIATRDDALREAARAIRAGLIVAVKGLGGFHLLTAADQPSAVARLRARKHRDEKPFAIMVAQAHDARRWCHVSPLEEQLLASPEAPIVLLARRNFANAHANDDADAGADADPATTLSGAASPNLPCLGVLLPSTPLHHLLLQDVQGPVIATSGNRSDEPLCTDEQDAVARLGNIADLLLVHDRPIVRAVDDSIVRVIAGRPLVLRRARGFAPLPVPLPSHPARRPANPADNDIVPRPNPTPVVLAVGGQQKNTVALAIGRQAFLSQHIGDLESAPSIETHERAIAELQRLHRQSPEAVACVARDAHPGYASSQSAAARWPADRLLPVQHHHAHLLACLADNGLEPPALGVIWDGTGDGRDGTIWGGEFLVARGAEVARTGALRAFPLPGGEAAVREPRRAALGLLHELLGDALWDRTDLPTLQAFTPAERTALRGALRRNVNCPRTSSAGRLFDAFASLLGLRQFNRHEGQAAMELESAAQRAAPTSKRLTSFTDQPEPALFWREGPVWIADWAPLVEPLLAPPSAPPSAGPAGTSPRAPIDVAAWRLHAALAASVIPAARRAGLPRVALSGGCFQNRLLTELTLHELESAGFQPVWHRQVPPNDGGLALGQLLAARLWLQARNNPPHTSTPSHP